MVEFVLGEVSSSIVLVMKLGLFSVLIGMVVMVVVSLLVGMILCMMGKFSGFGEIVLMVILVLVSFCVKILVRVSIVFLVVV